MKKISEVMTGHVCVASPRQARDAALEGVAAPH